MDCFGRCRTRALCSTAACCSWSCFSDPPWTSARNASVCEEQAWKRASGIKEQFDLSQILCSQPALDFQVYHWQSTSTQSGLYFCIRCDARVLVQQALCREQWGHPSAEQGRSGWVLQTVLLNPAHPLSMAQTCPTWLSQPVHSYSEVPCWAVAEEPLHSIYIMPPSKNTRSIKIITHWSDSPLVNVPMSFVPHR